MSNAIDLTENELKLSYALNKQLSSMHSLETSYGTLELDETMRKAVERVLRPILEARLKTTRTKIK